MDKLKVPASALLALSFLLSGYAAASNDPVKANPNTGASFNRYSYANNNPYKFTDPDGREVKLAVGGTVNEAQLLRAYP